MPVEKEWRVLVVSSSVKGSEFIEKNLTENCRAEYVTSGVEARLCLSQKDYDVVLINCPLKDEFGSELAENVIKDSYAGAMLLVRNDVYEGVSSAMEKIGVFCEPKPVSVQSFVQGLRMTITTCQRLKGLVRKTESLKEKMEEIKIVGRAKLLLITKLSFTEEEAHKYIEKQAMDRCVKKTVIACDIIKNYND